MEQLDWHNADIIAALRKTKKISCRQLSIANNLQPGTVQQALHRPYKNVENIIAEAIGVSAIVIWPSRFNVDGTRKDARKINRISKKQSNKTSKSNKDVGL
jgi:Ner family transcriptional regulator